MAFPRLLTLAKTIRLKPFTCLLIFVFWQQCSHTVLAQNCTANAGGAQVVCSSSTTLTGTVSGTLGSGGAAWAFVSGPVTPVISAPASLTTDVTGMSADGDYVFRLTYACGQGTSTSDVTITAHPRPASFTAGADITTVCATTGTTPLSGVIPPGFSGSWRSVNIYSRIRFGTTVSTNSSFSNTTTANPTFSLINKSNHGIDPAYYAILRITSADGLCSFEDTTVVRFAPNPQINVPTTITKCSSPGVEHYLDLTAPPYFSTAMAGSAGTVQNGTTVTLQAISQPAGGNIDFNRLDNSRMFLSGVNVPGTYVFTLTVTSGCGTYTTPQITYNFQGLTPHNVNFQPTGHGAPEQLVNYASSNSGGEVHCGIASTSTPETFYFSLNPLDPPNTLTTVSPSGIIPGGVAPTVVVTGAGTMDRSAVVTPPAGGWQIGTYRFNVSTRNSNGDCGINQVYYIHISDNSRPDVTVSDAIICREGTDPAATIIQLPAVYKGVVNPSYFQDFAGYYNFTLVSKPAGAANPVYETSNLRTLTSISTVISNFTLPGDYVFQIKPFNGPGVGPFLEQEYACAGKSMTGTFTVHVDDKINANAGADQTSTCSALISLQGDSPGAGSGNWEIVSFPSGSTPAIASASSPSTQVSGLNVPGSYVFRWTITSPNSYCTSSDEVTYTVTRTPTLGTTTQPTCLILTGAIQLTQLPSGSWTINRTGTSPATITGTGSSYTDSGLAPGSYSYTITSAGGCTSDPSAPVTISAASCTPPTANPVHYTLPVQPVPEQVLTLNGATGNPPAPNGQDAEDGTLGGTVLTSTLVVTTLPTNGTLIYKGTAVTTGQIIPNFDASLLTLQLTGTGYTSVTFEYTFIDGSGLQGAPAPYTVDWQSALPVTLADFRLAHEQSGVILSWVTSQETNSNYAEILHSVNAQNWVVLDQQRSHGESTALTAYSYYHNTPVPGMNYYRLKFVDKDNSYAFSPVRSIVIEGLPDRPVLYPNPAIDRIQLKNTTSGEASRVLIYTLSGRKCLDTSLFPVEGLNISALPAGLYLVHITFRNGAVSRHKLNIRR
jgi:hypothetical protein